MKDRYAKPTFSLNRYNNDGDVWEHGVYLHFGMATIKVADTQVEYKNFVSHLKFMESEICTGEIGTISTTEGD